MTSVIFATHKKPRQKRGFSVYSVAATAALQAAEGLMLGGQRPNQRIVLACLLGGRELNTVGNKAYLRILLGNKVTHGPAAA